MEVFRIASCKYINDLSGAGSAKYGGRWNSKGEFMLYTSSTASLALLETIVHMAAIPIENYCLTKLIIPESKIVEVKFFDLPPGWVSYPAPDQLKAIGDKFLKDNYYIAMVTPSALLPEEKNVLINPLHHDFTKVSIAFTREISIDKKAINPCPLKRKYEI